MDKYCLCCGKPLLEEGIWHKKCLRSFFGMDSLPRIDFNENELQKLAIEQIENKKAIAGVQEKLSLHLEVDPKKRPRLTIFGLPSGYILKPQSSTYKQLPEFEWTAMLLADLCDIPTVPHALIPINDNNELAYITKRIDRKNGKKVHMEDFAQASGVSTINKYRSNYEECAHLIEKYSSKPFLDKAKFFKCLYFCFVIGNSDVHLKNFSFIMDENGNLSLAPFYDLLPTKVILPTDHEDLGMLMNGRKTNLHKHDFDKFCDSIGIGKANQRLIIKSIDNLEEQMEEIINRSSLHQNAKTTWIKMIKANIKRAKQP